MALFKMDSARSGYPQCVILQGSFIAPASSTYNQQINPQLQTLGNPGTGAGQVSNTVNPTGVRVNIFANPFPGQAIPATNAARTLPSGLIPGGVTPLGSEFVADLTGFPADMVCVQMDMCRQARNTVAYFMQASIIDTVNKLLYMQCCSVASGSSAAAPAGSVISFQVAFKDSIGI